MTGEVCSDRGCREGCGLLAVDASPGAGLRAHAFLLLPSIRQVSPDKKAPCALVCCSFLSVQGLTDPALSISQGTRWRGPRLAPSPGPSQPHPSCRAFPFLPLSPRTSSHYFAPFHVSHHPTKETASRAFGWEPGVSV